jgi:hypothetical protein
MVHLLADGSLPRQGASQAIPHASGLPLLGLWPHHDVVALDLKRRGEACREATQLVEFRLLCGNGAEDRFVLRVVSDKGKSSTHERCIVHSHMQHQTNPVRMLATAMAGFKGEAPNSVKDRLALVYFDPERHVRAMAHHEVCTRLNRRVGNLYLVVQHFMIQTPVMAGDDHVCLAT